MGGRVASCVCNYYIYIYNAMFWPILEAEHDEPSVPTFLLA